MKNQVSIILPNYNSSQTITATVNSVVKQSYNNWELIIVDDCSNRKTRKILTKFKNKKIKIFYLKKNRGAAYCRNLGIKKSNSNFLAFIDSDDLWHKNKLKLQINYMKTNNYFFTYTNYKTFKKNHHQKYTIKPPKKFWFNSFIKNTSIGTSTMIVKRSLTKGIKFPNTLICEDYYYKCQLLKKVGFAYCYPSCLSEYQIREDSLQSNRIRNLFWIWKINKDLNKLDIFKNLISLFFISFNSIKKYGLR
jgi:teichuronic acid biosynthesis glycosyltransferase TuaG